MTDIKRIKNNAKALLERAHSLENESQTKTLYRDWAQTYDTTMIDGLGYLSPKKGAQILNRLSPGLDAIILDVGTGTGLVGKELSVYGYSQIDGIDYSAEMLKVARKTSYYQTLFEADLNQKLELGDSLYDGLICIGTFTHGHVGVDCLDELFRILKPEGKFVTAIRKDYWHSAGFSHKIDQLIADGKIVSVIHEEDSNYTSSAEPESWFMAWQKL
jgi:ubiquinone/menaquinone biosynthesis C-methylase UbiE